jgi:hypothetical protein
MRSTIEGDGQLESIKDSKTVWQVHFRFDIETTGRRSPRSLSTGTVQSLDERPIPEGVYYLRFNNKVARVENSNVGWMILSPLPQ